MGSVMCSATSKKIAIVGGTGDQGPPLAMRWALRGHQVRIGSRNNEKARLTAEELNGILKSLGSETGVGFGVNEDIVRGCDVVVLTIPFSALPSMLDNLRDRIDKDVVVLSPIVPVEFQAKEIVLLPVQEGSAAQLVSAKLPHTKVVSALHTVSSKLLEDYGFHIEGDVIVCGNDRLAKRSTMALVEQIPNLKAFDGGELANSRFVEDFTVFLLKMGRINKKPNLGLRFTSS